MPGYGVPWTPDEDAALRATYPGGGTEASLPVLPARTKNAIRRRARAIGIRVSDRRFKSPMFRNWPTGAVTACPLRDAVIGELADIRNRERITALAVDSLKQIVHYGRSPRISTIIETAELLGLDLNERNGWLEFANRVAARLPEYSKEAEPCATQR